MKKLYKHRIIPGHAGGTYEPSNVILVTIEQHAEEHRLLWEKHGRWQDKLAWKALSGQINKEEIWIMLNKENGKKQGLKNKHSGFIQQVNKNRTKEQKTNAGKMSVKICRELKVNSFFDPELHRKVATLGGKVQGKINAESGHCKKIAQNYWKNVKDGTVIRKKYMWITNGIDNKTIEVVGSIPKGYKKGRSL